MERAFLLSSNTHTVVPISWWQLLFEVYQACLVPCPCKTCTGLMLSGSAVSGQRDLWVYQAGAW